MMNNHPVYIFFLVPIIRTLIKNVLNNKCIRTGKYMHTDNINNYTCPAWVKSNVFIIRTIY